MAHDFKKIKPKSVGGFGVEKSASLKDKKTYPTIRLSLDQFPEVRDWKVGEDYTVALQLKQISMNISKEPFMNNEAGFEIHGYKVISRSNKGGSKKKTPRYEADET